MIWVDLVIVAVILLSAILGAKIGLLRSLFLFGAFVFATVIGRAAAPLPASLLESLIDSRDVRIVVGFTILFVLILVIVNIIGAVICRIIDFTPLKWIDRGIGGILGLLAGVIVVGVAIIYLISSPTSNSSEWIDKSFLVPIIKSLISPILGEFHKSEPTAATVANVLNIPRLFLVYLAFPTDRRYWLSGGEREQ